MNLIIQNSHASFGKKFGSVLANIIPIRISSHPRESYIRWGLSKLYVFPILSFSNIMRNTIDEYLKAYYNEGMTKYYKISGGLYK